MKVNYKEHEGTKLIKISEIPLGECFAVTATSIRKVYLKTEVGFVELNTGKYRLDVDSRTDACAYLVNAEVVVNG